MRTPGANVAGSGRLPHGGGILVEAIAEIERQLQAGRQRAELPPSLPLPVVVPTAASPTREEPGGPGASAKDRRRRSLGLAVAAVVLAIVAIATQIAGHTRSAAAIGRDRLRPLAPVVAALDRAAPRPGPPSGTPAAIVPRGPTRPPTAAKPAPDEAPRAVVPDPPRREDPPRLAMPAVRRIEGLRDPIKVIDPDGDCRILFDSPGDRASIFVPGVAHLLSAEIDRMNAPRILREVAGDFEARVNVRGVESPGSRASTARYAPYHGAGILVASDPATYVRLEIAADHRKAGSFAYANFEFRRDGRLATTWGLKIEDGSSYLRLRRLGDEFRAAFSPDGQHWTSFAPLVAKLPDRLEIGLVAVSSSSKPLDVHFEEFQLTAGSRPGSGFDGDDARLEPPPSPVPAGTVKQDRRQ